MTRTELKIKLAEQVLPVKDWEVIRHKMNYNPEFSFVRDYELAEKIVNFLVKQGLKIEE
jgi:hypothetical protein